MKMKKKIIIVAVFLLVALSVGFIFLQTASVSKAKRVKKQYKKVYNFTVEGDCTNADVDIAAFDDEDPKNHTLFRKISIPSIKTKNMPKMELFHLEYAPSNVYPNEMWQPIFSTSYYLIDGNILIRYGGYDSDDPSGGCSNSRNLGEFRLFIY